MAQGSEKTGSWHNEDHKVKDAINKLLEGEPVGSEWTVVTQVKKKSNPVHDYRIVLRPL